LRPAVPNYTNAEVVMQNQDIKTSKAFEALEKPQDIIDYLNAKSRLNTSKQLYQYTSVSALVSPTAKNMRTWYASIPSVS